MRIAIIAALLALVALSPSPAHAEAPCPGSPDTSDMAGLYLSQESLIRLHLTECGSVGVLWENAYGTHDVPYHVVDGLRGGGVVAVTDSGGFGLDGRVSIGIKPAEPGFVQIITLSPFGTDLRVYHLAKID